MLPECRLVCVESGAEALAHWADARPDLALIDMHLADMGGIELLRQVRAAGHVTPCVAVSADNPLDLVRAAQDAGFAEYWLSRWIWTGCCVACSNCAPETLRGNEPQ